MPTIEVIVEGELSIIFDMGSLAKNETFSFFYDLPSQVEVVTITPLTNMPGMIDRNVPGFLLNNDNEIVFRAGTKGSPPVRVHLQILHSIIK